MLRQSLIPGRGRSFFSYAREDIPAGLVVFLVALPLCLGVATASNAPPLAGLIAGIVGGLIVPLISRSPLSVAGPAAGLTVLVAAAIQELGYAAFLMSVVLSGGLQVAFGALRLGLIAHFLPSAAIQGMLSAIGLLIILKQIPHALGYDKDFEGDEAFLEPDGHNTFNALLDAMSSLSPGAIAVSLAGFALALAWPYLEKKLPKAELLPLPLGIVLLGVAVGLVSGSVPGFQLSPDHLVNLPPVKGPSDLAALITWPDFGSISNSRVWWHALMLSLIGSLETLLSLEAIDGLDPYRRISPNNRELVAQGAGNAFSGLLGGIPVTSVIVRSSANVHAGGKTRLATMVHGALLLLGLLLLGRALNHVPLAALAVVLILVGWKLNTPKVWKKMWNSGPAVFVPFVVTIGGILATDLLKGTLLGAALGLFFAVREQQKNALLVTESEGRFLLTFLKDMTFLQRAAFKEVLRKIPDGAYVALDRRSAAFVDHDIEELISSFAAEAESRDITFTSDPASTHPVKPAILHAS
jgi:MFS superfamily sulfate permease-like transporter